jgi:uncharacterized damage-inducible protein DinB
MITPAYTRTMAEYNAEMNRRLYGAAARLSDVERRKPRGAFWGSIHGTLTHILWGDRQWMSRFDAWPKPATPIKQSASMIDDFATLTTEREKADVDISRWANKVDDAWLAEDLTWFSGGRSRGARSATAARYPLLQPPDASPRAGPCDADRRRPKDRRHRPVPAGPRDRRPRATRPLTKARQRRDHAEQACRRRDVRSARLLASGLVVLQSRPVGGRNRGLGTSQAGGRTARDALVADKRVHRRFIVAGRRRCSDYRFYSLAGHGEAPPSNRLPITVPSACSTQFRMLLRFSAGIAGCDIAPPCRLFLPPGLLRELAAAGQDEHPASFRFVRDSSGIVTPAAAARSTDRVHTSRTYVFIYISAK